jgi:hypothetical protein
MQWRGLSCQIGNNSRIVTSSASGEELETKDLFVENGVNNVGNTEGAPSISASQFLFFHPLSLPFRTKPLSPSQLPAIPGFPMKSTFLILFAFALYAQAEKVEILERGMHHKRVRVTDTYLDEKGETRSRTSEYTELEMHRRAADSTWVESSPAVASGTKISAGVQILIEILRCL